MPGKPAVNTGQEIAQELPYGFGMLHQGGTHSMLGRNYHLYLSTLTLSTSARQIHIRYMFKGENGSCLSPTQGKRVTAK